MSLGTSTTAERRLVDLELIRDAARLIESHAVRTPLLASPWPGLWLKPENLQPIGAFKIRGALTAISRLDPDVRAHGVIAHSSGNSATSARSRCSPSSMS